VPQPATRQPARVGLPDGLARFDFAAVGSADGNAWMAALPALVAGLADDWNLALGEMIRHGFHAVVVAARQSNRPVALKVAWPPEQVVTTVGKAVAWSFVRSIDYWLWGLENGLTIDPVRCQRIASALEPLAARLSLP